MRPYIFKFTSVRTGFSYDDGKVKQFECKMGTCDEWLYKLENSLDSSDSTVCLLPTR